MKCPSHPRPLEAIQGAVGRSKDRVMNQMDKDAQTF